MKPDFARYEHEEGRAWGEELLAQKEASVAMDDDVIHGAVIMPKLGNATAKYASHLRPAITRTDR